MTREVTAVIELLYYNSRGRRRRNAMQFNASTAMYVACRIIIIAKVSTHCCVP